MVVISKDDPVMIVLKVILKKFLCLWHCVLQALHKQGIGNREQGTGNREQGTGCEKLILTPDS
jgi:hypothetical protein